VRVVRTVLEHVRKSLTHDEAAILIRNMPDVFKLMLVSDWRYAEQPVTVHHLDELADNVYKETNSQPGKLFSTEIEALNTVILVIKKLDKFFGLLDFNVLRYTITEEIKQAAAMEDAA
jgi:uncharacterized protein (DUF2267 family)